MVDQLIIEDDDGDLELSIETVSSAVLNVEVGAQEVLSLNDGPPGVGVPPGGTTGQVLQKNSNVPYDTEWADPSGGVTDHGALTGLADDDHSQYHNDARGDARYYTQSQLNSGQLDSRYYTESEVNTALSSNSTGDRARANHTGTQTASTISDFNTAADARIANARGAANGIAPLDASQKVPAVNLPAIALTDVFVVNSQAAQLALTAEEGDVAVRTDLNKSYIHNGGTAGTMSDWQELLTPTDQVISVNGQTGAVVLSTSNISEGSNQYFTNERAQDAVGTALADTAEVKPTYDDAGNQITFRLASNPYALTFGGGLL